MTWPWSYDSAWWYDTPLSPELITPPAELAVSLAELKTHARVDHADDDADLTSYLKAAIGYFDGYSGVLGRAIVTQTWEFALPGFPVGRLRLPLAGVQSITSVKYYDADSVLQTVTGGTYRLLKDSDGHFIDLAPDQSWPSPIGRDDAVTVRFVAGYGLAAAVPEGLKVLIKLLAADLYQNREAIGQSGLVETPIFNSLMSPYRAGCLAP